jgi:dTDP-4-dehydrorhamnose 3,5-epimerase
MKASKTGLPGVLLLEPDVFEDDRGYFMETYQRERYREFGIDCLFRQDNLSFSIRDTLRGLHYQYPRAQSKLVQAVQGEIYDVAVDIRKGSPDFGRWTSVRLSHRNRRQLFVPGGFAHGFCVLSKTAVVLYKCDELYAPDCEGGIIWSDPGLGIDWPVHTPLLSQKDGQYPNLVDIRENHLPEFAKIR